MKFIARFFFSVLVLLVISEYVPGISVDSLYAAVIATVVLGLLNAVVRPVLLILTLPITVLTLGLFTFVINAGLFMFAASFLEGLWVEGFVPALIGSLVLTIGSVVGSKLIS